MTAKRKIIYLGIIGTLLMLMLSWYLLAFRLNHHDTNTRFDGERAYADVQRQVAFGARIPGSVAHARTLDWMRQELESAGWRVEIQQAQAMGHTIQNLRAYRTDAPPAFILGTHYDSRLAADRDPDPNKRSQPVPGADDLITFQISVSNRAIVMRAHIGNGVVLPGDLQYHDRFSVDLNE